VLFGLLDYGLWYSDSLSARSGVREAVRKAVVQGTVDSSCTTGNYLDKVRCSAKHDIGAISGPAYVKIATTSDGWVKGKPLVVCAMVRVDGVTGVTPLPGDRIIRSRTEMSIEMDTPKPTGATGTGVQSSADTPPVGQNWGWCS
jgi:hypothetical protein